MDLRILNKEDCVCSVCQTDISVIVQDLCSHFFGEQNFRLQLKVNRSMRYFTRSMRGEFGFFCDAIDNLLMDIVKSMAIVMFEEKISYKMILESSQSRYGFDDIYHHWENQDNLKILDQLVYLHDMTPYVIYDTIMLCVGSYRYGILNDENARHRYICVGSKFGIEAYVLKSFIQQVLHSDIGFVSVGHVLYDFFFNREIDNEDHYGDVDVHYFVVNAKDNYRKYYNNCDNDINDFTLVINHSCDVCDLNVKEIVDDCPEYIVMVQYSDFINGRFKYIHSEDIEIFCSGQSKLYSRPAIPVCRCETTIAKHDMEAYKESVDKCGTKKVLKSAIIKRSEECEKGELECEIKCCAIERLVRKRFVPVYGYRITFSSFDKFLEVFTGYYNGKLEKTITYSGMTFEYWLISEYCDKFSSKNCRSTYNDIEVLNKYMNYRMWEIHKRNESFKESKKRRINK